MLGRDSWIVRLLDCWIVRLLDCWIAGRPLTLRMNIDYAYGDKI